MESNLISQGDCEKMMDEFTSYDEKVIQGFIVQMYYHAYSMNIIYATDEELKKLAKEFDGIPTGEQGIHSWRRDIDFKFSSLENAFKFKEKIQSSARFYLHEGLNNLGQIIPKPSFEELERKKMELKRVNCNK